MDIRDIKQRMIEFRKDLARQNVRPDIIILYGSYAEGKNRKDSDIDIAVISRDFGKNRFREGSMLNLIAHKIDPRIEAVPFGLDEYMSPGSISPLLAEINKKRKVLL